MADDAVIRANVISKFKKFLPTNTAINIEKSIVNKSIIESESMNIDPTWESPTFVHIYKTTFCNVFTYLQNEQIRLKIIDKEILSKDVAFINPIEICPEKWTPQIFEEGSSVEDGIFQCKNCNSRKTTYYSVQTRSADEPMTNFITCVHCGNRWKM